MKLKNSTVFQLTPIVDGRPAMNGAPAIKGIMDLDGLPGAVRYGLAKSMREIRHIFGDIETTRVKLVREHAIRGKDGEPVVKGGRFVMSDQKKFDVAFQELMDVENDVPVHRVLIDDRLLNAPGLTGRHVDTLLALGILKEDEPEKPDATD